MKALKTVVYILFFLIAGLVALKAGPSFSVRTGEEEHFKTREKVFDIFRRRLPQQYTYQAGPIANTIMAEAAKHKIDPMIITAVIAGESNFNPVTMGPIGEIGLMQLRPSTAKWIASMTMQKWTGAHSLRNPVMNIRIGMAYLGYLKKRYSPRSGFLYLAAYNMGETSLLRFLSKNIQPNIYTKHVMKNYLALVREVSVWPRLAEVQ